MAASHIQELPASDLRSFAKEARRDHDHRAKWALGGGPASGKKCPHGWEEPCTCHARPIQPPGRKWRGARPLHQRVHNNITIQKSTLRRDLEADDLFTGPISDSSADEEIADASAAPRPASEAEVMYSYDAPRGPAEGSQILSLAITKAVERFENKETEKLAKEYEFIDGKDNDADTEFSTDDDDFELVGHVKI